MLQAKSPLLLVHSSTHGVHQQSQLITNFLEYILGVSYGYIRYYTTEYVLVQQYVRTLLRSTGLPGKYY